MSSEQQEQKSVPEIPYREGQHVKYKIATAETTGVITKVLTSTQTVEANRPHMAQASEEAPKFLLVNDNTQKENECRLDDILGAVEE